MSACDGLERLFGGVLLGVDFDFDGEEGPGLDLVEGKVDETLSLGL